MGQDGDGPAPLISVALCTYNGAAHLPQQLESVQSQSWTRLEVVVVDDASTDGTWPLLQRAAAKDRRIRALRNDANLGFAANFQRAMSLCTGELIAPCDQDDIWQPAKLADLQAALGSHTLAYCDSSLIDEHGQPLGQRVSQRLGMVQGSDPLAFAFWNCISGHAMLFRRELLSWALPLPGVQFHDWWLAFVAASHGTIAYLDRPLVNYRQHAGSQTDVVRRKGPRSDAAARAEERLRWLRALACHPSPHQPLFERLHMLAAARHAQWFCPRWCSFLSTHAPRLMAINRREPFGRFALKQFFGLRWRRTALSLPQTS